MKFPIRCKVGSSFPNLHLGVLSSSEVQYRIMEISFRRYKNSYGVQVVLVWFTFVVSWVGFK